MRFETKVAVVLRDDLDVWQKLNVTAFTISGIAGTVDGIIGAPYEDASGVAYLPMLVEPVLIYEADGVKLRTVYERALRRGVALSIFTRQLFSTGHDEANRAAVRAVPSERLDLAGMAMRADRGVVDKVLKGVHLHG